MPKTINRIMGKKGRSTIPLAFRIALDMRRGDTLSYTLSGRSVVIRKERRCECADDENVSNTAITPEKDDATGKLTDILNDLSPSQLRSAIIGLSVRWAQMEEGREA